MKTCAVYARVSTNMQGESLENQVDYAQEYIRRLGNDYRLDETCVYTDFDQSGYYTRFLQRPAIQQALEDAKKNKYEVIVFKEISRISRDQAEHMEIVSRFRQHGIRMIAINDNLDSDRPETLDLLGIHSVMSEMESKRISSRVSSGKKSFARRGLWIGEAPIGYRVDPQARRLTVDSTYSKIPPLIFQLFTQDGLGTFKIAEYLNSNLMYTKNGRLWSRVTVNRVLRNPAYVGDLVYGRTRNTLRRMFDDSGYSKVRGRDPIPVEDWVIVRDVHPPLVTRDTFELAQAILNTRAKQNPRRSKHPLTGILKCGRCGAGMVCQRQSYEGKVYRYYTCARAFRFGRQMCNQPNLNADETEHGLWEYILSGLESYGELDVDVQVIDKVPDAGKRRNQMECDLRKAQLGLERLLMDTDISKQTFARLKAKYLKTIQGIELEMQRDCDSGLRRPELQQWNLKVNDYLQELRSMDMANLLELRRILHELVQTIRVNGREITEVELKYSLVAFYQ